MVRIKTSLNAFVSAWGSSVASRLRAAKIYADAAKKGSTETKAQFWALKGFEHWTDQQWDFLYWLGSGRISAKLIDAKNLAVPITMAFRNVRIAMQESILENGLKAARINGTVRTIQYRYIQQKHIRQVFKENGEERTIDEQVAWLRQHEHDNIELLGDGKCRIRHGCILVSEDFVNILSDEKSPLTPEDFFKILISENAPLGPDALIAAATELARRHRE